MNRRNKKLKLHFLSHLVFDASINPQTAKTKQLTPGIRNNIFQYEVVSREDVIAMVTMRATMAVALNMFLVAFSRERAKNKTLIAMISNPSCRQIWSE